MWTAPDAGKVKRIRRNGEIRVVPCTLRGRPRGVPVPGHAELIGGRTLAGDGCSGGQIPAGRPGSRCCRIVSTSGADGAEGRRDPADGSRPALTAGTAGLDDHAGVGTGLDVIGNLLPNPLHRTGVAGGPTRFPGVGRLLQRAHPIGQGATGCVGGDGPQLVGHGARGGDLAVGDRARSPGQGGHGVAGRRQFLAGPVGSAHPVRHRRPQPANPAAQPSAAMVSTAAAPFRTRHTRSLCPAAGQGPIESLTGRSTNRVAASATAITANPIMAALAAGRLNEVVTPPKKSPMASRMVVTR